MYLTLLSDLHYDGSTPARERLLESIAKAKQSGAERLIVLGDLANGRSAADSVALLGEIAALFSEFSGPVHYLPGNHDLDYISKAEFFEALGGAPSRLEIEAGGYTLMSVDANFSPDGSAYCRGNFEWRNCLVPPEELARLRERLAATDNPVILFSHQRFDERCIHAVKNAAEVRALIDEAGNVAAVFHGHCHEAGFQELGGVSYYTLGAHVDGVEPLTRIFHQ